MDIRLLGPVEARIDGRPVPVDGAKQRALLAILALNAARTVPAERLIEGLWGEEPPPTAAKTLRTYVSRMRKALQTTGDGTTIVTRPRGYELRVAPDDVDARRFERLVARGAPREALALWRGRALEDVADEPFAAVEIRRLEELRLDAIEHAVDGELAAGEHHELVGELEALVMEHPLRERLRGQLMLALYLGGRQADALAAYREARATLVDQIGVEPGPELRRLHEAILRHDSSLSHAASQAPALGDGRVVVCPFKGLAWFDVEDAGVFFGRELLVSALVARLASASLLGVVGASGSGKSSLLRAGLLASLEQGALPGSERWPIALLRPGEYPLRALERARAQARDGKRLIVAIDQFEEVFTACGEELERAAFIDALVACARDERRRTLVLVALRADFYGRCAGYPELAALLSANHVLVGPMRRDELRRAIELPARRAGLTVDSDVVDALIADLEGEAGGLPLLSTALLELWQRRDGRRLRMSAYEQTGGVRGAIARLAENAYARLDPAQRETARRILLRLADHGDGESAVRRRVELAELDTERDERVAEVLTVLAGDRLVTIGEGAVEVAHEALLREWPRLRSWLEQDSAGRRLHQYLRAAAREWDAGGRDPGELYRGARLAAALEWSAAHGSELNASERTFLDAGRAASERSQRRLRAVLAGVAVLLVLSIVAGVVALEQRGTAREQAVTADAQRLGARALVEDDLDRALLLARQGVALDDSAQTRGNLLAALQRAPAAIGIMHGHGDALRGIAISPDGGSVAVAGGGEVRFFDAGTYKQIGEPVRGTGQLESVAYSPDGRTVAIGGDHIVWLIDAGTREKLAETAIEGLAARVAFTSDGSQLVVLFTPGDIQGLGGRDAQITIRNASTLEPIGRSITPHAFVGAYVGYYFAPPQFALTADDRILVTASEDGELARWDLRSRRKTRTERVTSGLHAVALSPDGLNAAIGSEHGLQFVDLRSGSVRTTTGGLTGNPNWILFSPDGRTLVSTSLDKTATLWDVESATPLQTLRGHSNSVQQPVFSPDGRTLYTVSHDGTAIAWDLRGDRRLGRPFTFTHDRKFSGDYDGHPGEFSPDGRLIAIGLKHGGIALWDARELAPVGPPLLETDGEVKTLAFSPDGRTLAAATAGGSLTLWDVDSRSLLHGPLSAGGGFLLVGIGFSPDGARLAAASECCVQVWDVATGTGRGEIAYGSMHDLAFSADGTMIASARPSLGGAEVWDVATHTSIASIDGTPQPLDNLSVNDLSVALSPDGRTLAVGGFGNVVRLWDVRSRKLIRELDQGGNGAFTLEFSPDGRTLAISGFEPVASLWDVATGTQIGPQLTAGDRRTMIDLSPDGRRLLETHGNGQGAVWDVDPASWARRACTLANRTLTREEWNEFVPGRPYKPACADRARLNASSTG